MPCSVQIFCVANEQATLTRNLLASPEIADGRVGVSVIWGAKAASAAYRDAIASAHADIVVFAHQDVYFPEGWFSQLRLVCQRLNSVDPCWAVAGICGMTNEGEFVAHLWDAGLGSRLRRPVWGAAGCGLSRRSRFDRASSVGHVV